MEGWERGRLARGDVTEEGSMYGAQRSAPLPASPRGEASGSLTQGGGLERGADGCRTTQATVSKFVGW